MGTMAVVAPPGRRGAAARPRRRLHKGPEDHHQGKRHAGPGDMTPAQALVVAMISPGTLGAALRTG